MTLASRLSTQANLGKMTSAKEIMHMVVGNIALVQVQATVAAFIVSMFSLAVGVALANGVFELDHALLVTASSMFTATSSCFVLGEFYPGNLKVCFYRRSELIGSVQKIENIPIKNPMQSMMINLCELSYRRNWFTIIVIKIWFYVYLKIPFNGFTLWKKLYDWCSIDLVLSAVVINDDKNFCAKF